jgi:hypothetical protein
MGQRADKFHIRGVTQIGGKQMKRSLKTALVLAVLCMGLSILAFGKDKPGPMTGTWVCLAHGSQQGDISYTYNLVQIGEKVSGNFAENSDAGQKADIKDGSYKDKTLNMAFEAYGGTVTITGTMTKRDVISGKWTHSGGDEGTWDCTKGSAK